jgi:hypothetical protein
MIYIIQCDMSGMTAKFPEKMQKGRDEQGLQMHQPGKHGDVTTPAEQPGLLAPDTSRMNRLGERSVPAHGATRNYRPGERAVGMREVGELHSAA